MALDNPMSLKEGLTDDAQALFTLIAGNQDKTIKKLDTIIWYLTNGVKVIGMEGGGGTGGNPIQPPVEVPDDLTDLESSELEITDDVLAESHDGIVGTLLTDLAPIVYGSFSLYADDVVVPVTDYYVQYTTGQVILITPANFKGKRIVAKHKHEVVLLENTQLQVNDEATFTYKSVYPNVVASTVTLSNSKATNFKPTKVDERTGIIHVAEENFTKTATMGRYNVVLPLAYARVTGTTATGSQVVHSFVDNYAALFTAAIGTEGDNGEYVVQHSNKTSTLLNTGAEGMSIDYTVIHDSTGRIYIGESNYTGPAGISVTHNLGTAGFKGFVITNNATEGYVGEVWISSKTQSNFKVHNTGSDITTPFRYVVIKDSIGTEMGSANFNFDGTTINHNLALKDYSVVIQPTEDSDGDLGDVWVEIEPNSFTVFCTGGATTSFDYLIIEN